MDSEEEPGEVLEAITAEVERTSHCTEVGGLFMHHTSGKVHLRKSRHVEKFAWGCPNPASYVSAAGFDFNKDDKRCRNCEGVVNKESKLIEAANDKEYQHAGEKGDLASPRHGKTEEVDQEDVEEWCDNSPKSVHSNSELVVSLVRPELL